MKVLIVASKNCGHFSPFIIDQVNSILDNDKSIDIEYFGVDAHGIIGYLSCLPKLCKIISAFNPDLIHAHYGLSGLLANLQRKVPVITTYHGSDINDGGIYLFLSKICMYISSYNIFVSDKLYQASHYKRNNYVIQSCGVDLSTFHQCSKINSREIMGWKEKDKYVLFSGAYDNKIKNSSLAKSSIALIEGCTLIELKGYSREQVNLLMNSVDSLLVTSNKESGPLVVKEAMSCGCPIVSVDVGDVREVMGDTKGCYIAERDAKDIADKIMQAFTFNNKTEGRQRIIDLKLDINSVAKNIIIIYHKISDGESVLQ